MRLADSREGFALLEVIVALTILACAGTVAVTLTSEASSAVHHIRGAEKDIRAASAFLASVSLWTRADFDRHLGDRVQGDWIMRIGRPEPSLYSASLLDSASRSELLRTEFYRPLDADAK
ncbi:MAG: prepilin-type N-terminal cleavage/methylation domain-containing protein [Gemmatimonadaceae bacterium]|nr:prepilin-type N-terminal cleavage/methylation domain-containing protein [Gemmatimonadaceae bacterium]